MHLNYFVKFHFISQHEEPSLNHTWPQTKLLNNQHISKCENRVSKPCKLTQIFFEQDAYTESDNTLAQK